MATEMEHSLRAADVDLGRVFKVLIEANAGRRVEDDGHAIDELLHVAGADAQTWPRHVSAHGHQLL